MTSHKFLLIRKKDNLSDYEKLLYDAYSTKVKNILLIASKLIQKEFDTVKILFWGLDGIPEEEDYKQRCRTILVKQFCYKKYTINLPTSQHFWLSATIFLL